jgi:hypothetical protein
MLPRLRLGEHVTVVLGPKYIPSIKDTIVFPPPRSASQCGPANESRAGCHE